MTERRSNNRNEVGKSTEPVETVEDYYRHPVVERTIFEFLGGNYDDNNPPPSLTETSRDNLETIQRTLSCEYVTLSNLKIKEEKGGTPARSVKPHRIPHEISREPRTEIFQSLWQKDAPDSENYHPGDRKPTRTLGVIDIEHYHKQFPGKPLSDPRESLRLAEPSYEAISEVLDEYGVSRMAILTGRGTHFVLSVPYHSPVMDRLIDIGGHIEESIAARHRFVPSSGESKRDRPVPPNAQKAHKGIAFLTQFLVTQSINDVRKKSEVPVDVSDMSQTEGVAIDLTPMMLRGVPNAETGVLGSIYIKPEVKREHFGEHIVRESRLLTRVARHNGKDIGTLNELLRARENYRLGINNLERSTGQIPDSSNGLVRLIDDYQQSALRELHLALDENPGDPPEEWEKTYRNYDAITDNIPEITGALYHANPRMLEPSTLNHVINSVFDRWGGRENIEVAGHVRTFLRSIYEDPRFNWGKRFTGHYVAEQEATGWTAMMLGQRFEKK